MGDSSRIRQFQDQAQNEGWRIAMIPFDDSATMMRYETNWQGVVFMVIFLVSAISFVVSEPADRGTAIMGIAVGLLGMPISIIIAMRRKYRGWVKLKARCLDHELQATRGIKSSAWAWRWLCEFEFADKTYRVTPTYWLSWGPANDRSKQDAIAFGNKVMYDAGSIELWINPQNPLQAEVVGHDIKDRLLH